MATATKSTAKASDAPARTRTPAPDIDFKAVKATASQEPVVQTRRSALDSTPVPQWLRESWEKRTTVTRNGEEKLEGAAVELSPMSPEQVKYLKRLFTAGVDRMPGVGVKFAVTKNADGTETLKFQTKQRKAKPAAK